MVKFAIMTKVPITFRFQEKKYSGYFSLINGAGSSSLFHLMVDNYYFGQLWYTDTWRFESNAFPDMRELAEEFGVVVMGWYG